MSALASEPAGSARGMTHSTQEDSLCCGPAVPRCHTSPLSAEYGRSGTLLMPCRTGAADEATGQYGWLIAVSICTFANFVSNLGVNLQKLALQKRQDRQGPFYTLWIIGMPPPAPGSGPGVSRLTHVVRAQDSWESSSVPSGTSPPWHSEVGTCLGLRRGRAFQAFRVLADLS